MMLNKLDAMLNKHEVATDFIDPLTQMADLLLLYLL